MKNMIQALSEDKQAELFQHLNLLKQHVVREAESSFKWIIDHYGGLDIYTLSMYYNPGDWCYLVPTFSSEQGLKAVAQEYANDSVLSVEEYIEMLRWSSCDSPHHDIDQLESLMPDSEEVLTLLRRLIDDCEFVFEWDDYLRLVGEIHDLIHNAVVVALQQVASATEIAAYCQRRQTIIGLFAGDIDRDIVIDDVKAINGEVAYIKLCHDYQRVDELAEKEYKLYRQQKDNDEEENP